MVTHRPARRHTAAGRDLLLNRRFGITERRETERKGGDRSAVPTPPRPAFNSIRITPEGALGKNLRGEITPNGEVFI